MLPFTSAELSSQDKEVSMAWDDSDVPTDFFDQFTVADGPDSTSFRGGDSNSYGQFGPAEVVISPPSSTDLAPHSIASSLQGQDAMSDSAQSASHARSIPSHPSQHAQYPHHLAVHSESIHKVAQD